jgi:uncharacterized protein YunC (DUF1805 family)
MPWIWLETRVKIIYGLILRLTMLKIENVQLQGKDLTFYHLDMPSAPLLILKGKNGFVMCGYLNLEAAEKLGDFAVRATGVKDLSSLLDAQVAGCTQKARIAGVETGKKVSEIVSLL